MRGGFPLCAPSPSPGLPGSWSPRLPSVSPNQEPGPWTRCQASWGWATVDTAQSLLQDVLFQPSQGAVPLESRGFQVRKSVAWKGPWRPNSPNPHFMEDVPAAWVGKGLAQLPRVRAVPAPPWTAHMLSVGRRTPLGCFAHHCLHSACLRETPLETRVLLA